MLEYLIFGLRINFRVNLSRKALQSPVPFLASCLIFLYFPFTDNILLSEQGMLSLTSVSLEQLSPLYGMPSPLSLPSDLLIFKDSDQMSFL